MGDFADISNKPILVAIQRSAAQHPDKHIEAAGKIHTGPTQDLVEFSYTQGPKNTARADHFIQGGEHWAKGLKYDLAGAGLALAGYFGASALAGGAAAAATPLLMPLAVGAGIAGVAAMGYATIAHQIPALYHMYSGFFSSDKK